MVDKEADVAKLNLIGSVYTALNANTTGAKVTGTTTQIIDAITEFEQKVLIPMQSDNQVFIYGNLTGTPTFGGYNNCKPEELVLIIHPSTKANLKKYFSTFFNNTLPNTELISNSPDLPVSVASPTATGQGAQPTGLCTIQALNIVPTGCIMVVQKSALRQLYNLAVPTAQFYPHNLTTEFAYNKRYAQGILKFGCVGLYVNSHLDDQFSIPTSTTSSQSNNTLKQSKKDSE
jgi:hypothetical protein